MRKLKIVLSIFILTFILGGSISVYAAGDPFPGMSPEQRAKSKVNAPVAGEGKVDKVVQLKEVEKKFNGVAGDSPEADALAKAISAPKVNEVTKIKDPEKEAQNVAKQSTLDMVPVNPANDPNKAGNNTENQEASKNKTKASSIIAVIALVLVNVGIIAALVIYRKKVLVILKSVGKSIVEFKKSIFTILLAIAFITSIIPLPNVNASSSEYGLLQFGFDRNRTRTDYDSSVFKGYEDVFKSSPIKLNEYSKSQPTIVYSGGDPNKFTVYDISGDYLYKLGFDLGQNKLEDKRTFSDAFGPALGGMVTASHPTYHNGRIYFGTKSDTDEEDAESKRGKNDATFYVVDAASMTQVYRKTLGWKITAAPTVVNNDYVITGFCNVGTNGIAVYNIKSNSISIYNGVSGDVTSSGVVVGDTFYFTSDDSQSAGYLYEWKLGSSSINKYFVSKFDSGLASSLTYFGGYLIFTSKKGVFYYVDLSKKVIGVNNVAHGITTKTLNSPAATAVGGKAAAMFPISVDSSGNGRVYITEIDRVHKSDSMWSAQTSSAMWTAPIFAKAGSVVYIVYGDTSGHLWAQRYGGSADGFFSNGNNVLDLGSPIRSEISFTKNKIILSTQDGILHILSAGYVPNPNDFKLYLTIDSQTLKDRDYRIKSGYGFDVSGALKYSYSPSNGHDQLLSLSVNTGSVDLSTDFQHLVDVDGTKKRIKTGPGDYGGITYTWQQFGDSLMTYKLGSNKYSVKQDSAKIYPDTYEDGSKTVTVKIPDELVAQYTVQHYEEIDGEWQPVSEYTQVYSVEGLSETLDFDIIGSMFEDDQQLIGR